MALSIDNLYPANEKQRLAALYRYEILDTPPEKTFDRVTAMAARLFGVPISVISLVDQSRIWFKSHHGLNVHEIARDPGLCASAILQNEPWVVTDARADWRSKFNPLVTSDFGLQFYVGVPLRTPDDYNIGMLCVLDRKPHPVSKAQIADLKDLAAIVVEQMEQRLACQHVLANAMRQSSGGETAMDLAALIAREYHDSLENSFELITGLLRHQSRAIRGQGDFAQFTFAANRVAAIRLAHQYIAIASPKSAGPVSVIGFLCALCTELKGTNASTVNGTGMHGALGWADGRAISVEGVDISMPLRGLIALALIVTELVTNALTRQARQVKLSITREGGGYALSVADDGVRPPAGFDPAASEDLGMKVLLGQAQRLDARVRTEPSEGFRGARFVVSLPPSVAA